MVFENRHPATRLGGISGLERPGQPTQASFNRCTRSTLRIGVRPSSSMWACLPVGGSYLQTSTRTYGTMRPCWTSRTPERRARPFANDPLIVLGRQTVGLPLATFPPGEGSVPLLKTPKSQPVHPSRGSEPFIILRNGPSPADGPEPENRTPRATTWVRTSLSLLKPSICLSRTATGIDATGSAGRPAVAR